jgi:hypothetical protein
MRDSPATNEGAAEFRGFFGVVGRLDLHCESLNIDPDRLMAQQRIPRYGYSDLC